MPGHLPEGPEPAHLNKSAVLKFTIALVMAGCHFLLAGSNRINLQQNFSAWSVLFVCYLLYCLVRPRPAPYAFFLAGLACRLAYGWSWPAASDDFYRYLFDGRLFALGLNPYLERPINIMQDSKLSLDPLLSQVYSEMNSPYYYSVYPPLAQLLFALASFTGNAAAGVLILRLAATLAECLFFIVLRKQINPVALALYWLNPLFIHEFAGNLHLEGYAVIFISLALLSRRSMVQGAFLSLAIQAKLWPLLLLPLFARNWRKLLVVSLIGVLLTALSFAPFYFAEFPRRFFESLGLYYGKFLFNAGPAGLAAWLASCLQSEFQELPFDALRLSSLLLALLVFSFAAAHIFLGRFEKNNQFLSTGQVALVYVLCSAAVHPWYALPALFFSGMRPALLFWSFLLFFSYAAYLEEPAWLPFWFVALEYVLLLAAFAAEKWVGRMPNKKGLSAWWQKPLL
jgi:hypothetical protein